MTGLRGRGVLCDEETPFIIITLLLFVVCVAVSQPIVETVVFDRWLIAR